MKQNQFGTWSEFINEHKLDWETPAKKVVNTLFYPSRYKGQGRVFAAFKRTEFEKCNVIIIGQDPYPQRGLATGVAFEIPENKRMTPSLKAINEEISRTEGPASYKSLKPLVDQGVLFLNSALTVRPDVPGSHTAIWRKFLKEFVIAITSEKFVVISPWGAKAQLVCENNVLPFYGSQQINACHPVKDSYTGRKCFVGSNIFQNINTVLEFNQKPSIQWQQ
jgi:uracil-DNA glycosylase